MKRLFFCLMILLTVGACEEETVPQKDFVFVAMKNGQLWTATSVYAHYDTSQKAFLIFGTRRHEKYYQDEELRLSFPRASIQPNGTVQEFECAFQDIVGGDAVSNSFSATNGTSGNSLTLTGIDSVGHMLEGRFEVTLKRDAHWTKEEEYVRLLAGTFKVPYRTLAGSH